MYFILAATTSLAVGKSDTSMPKGRSSSSRSYLWTNNYPCSFVHNRYQNYASKSNDKNNFATIPPNNRHFLTVRRGKQCCLNASRGEEGRDQPAQPSAETTSPTAMPKSQQSSQQVMSSSTGNNREKMFNVVLTHCTADFDSLASAVGLAKLWTASTHPPQDFTNNSNIGSATTDDDPTSAVLDAKQANIPTYVVLPRGAHPAVQRFLSLHKHLFPIRSLKSLPADLSGLYRLGLVDAQRRDRVGPAEPLIQHAKQVLIMDHHIDSESDIPEVTDYIVEHVGSVSTMVVERLRNAQVPLTEAEATLLALGIHADTGSLRFDSTTARDAKALAWVMEQGASQTAIAEHAKSSLSEEQQGVLTQALLNTNSSVVHGVTVSTVLLSSEGFINGLAAVTQDALELTGSDVMLVAVVYDPKAAPSSRNSSSNLPSSSLRKKIGAINEGKLHSQILSGSSIPSPSSQIMHAEAWKGGEEMFKRRRLRAAFEKRDSDGSGYLERREISAALASSGVVTSDVSPSSPTSFYISFVLFSTFPLEK
jgi:nanoRNase/pAp phosphatase (c-di-AMP/oligoRNAs hydrolase)